MIDCKISITVMEYCAPGSRMPPNSPILNIWPCRLHNIIILLSYEFVYRKIYRALKGAGAFNNRFCVDENISPQTVLLREDSVVFRVGFS